MNELDCEIKNTTVKILPGRYAYVKTHNIPTNYFMITKDEDETTVVVEENYFEEVENVVKWFKVIEFKVAKPFLCVGFIAAITNAIAKRKKNVLVVSTFSKDYVLVREEDLAVVREAFQEMGFSL